ncbi:MAG: adenylosuccinate lyase, partial [Methanomicrobiales archaeon HGW-Methanomicrobiales-5]
DVLGADPEIVRYCSKNDIVALLNPDAYIGTSVRQVECVIEKLSRLCI